LLADNERLARSLARDYAQRALVPAFTWLGAAAPPSPSLATTPSAPTVTVISNAAAAAPPRWWLVQVRGAGGVWTTKLQPGAATQIAVDSMSSSNPNEIAVTAISATGVESEPAVVAWPPTGNAAAPPARNRRRR